MPDCPIRLVLSGGQTGADLAGWLAAQRFGIPTSGYMPSGFRNLTGLHPEFADLYGAREHRNPDYPSRTRSNVLWAEACLWFGDPQSAGGRLTLRLCEEFCRPHYIVTRSYPADLSAAEVWLQAALQDSEGVLLVAGHRESDPPSIEAWVCCWLCDFFLRLGLEQKQ